MTRLLLTAALLAATTTALAQDRTFERTLNVSAMPNLNVTTGSGNIHLHPGSASQIHIIGHVHPNHGWFGGDADSRAQQIANNPPISQSGNDITVGERNNNELFRNVSIDYDITLPREANITANSGSGDVEIQDVGSTLKAGTGSGNVRAHGIHGSANLQTGSGDIEFQQSAPGDVRAQTGSGNVHLDGISGGLKAGTGSGDIQISGHPTSDWRLDTGSGSIRLDVGAQAKFTLNASTGSGNVHLDQPFTMQGDVDRHHINASVNGGGPLIKAETGSGDIQIR
jgi:DUF4097 and DUF4098 domain-containing protein YvlB